MNEENYEFSATPNNGEAKYMRILPAPFELDTATLSDLVAAMQWLKWELKIWKGVLKAELKDGAAQEDIDNTNDEIFKTNALYEAIDDEVSKRLLTALNNFQS